jgi:antitoxin component of RelBE/YafQ-DinJ toxin-antitoxin module
MSTKVDHKWIQVRLSPEEKSIVESTAHAYNVDTSTLIRAALNYIIEHQAKLEIRHAGKLSAQGSMSA